MQVTFQIAEGEGTLGNTTVMTNQDGVASAGSWTLGTSPGPSVVTATARNLPTRSFTANATPGPPAAVSLSADREAVGLGEVVEVEVRAEDRYGNPTTGEPALLVEEVRWLHDHPVLEPSPTGPHRFQASAPGRARLHAALQEIESDTLHLEVTPPHPTVLGLLAPEVVTPSDTVVLRGFRMDELVDEEVTIDGDVGEVLDADSASLRVLLPAPDAENCRGAAMATVHPGQAPVHGALELRRARPDEFDMAPGEIRFLSPAHHECLRLSPHPGAAYSLAVVDTRAIERARLEAEPRFGYPDLRMDDPADFHSIWVEDRTPVGPPAVSSGSTIIPPPVPIDSLLGDVHVLTSPAPQETDGFRDQDEPWQVGDGTTVVVYSSQDRTYTDTPATIVRVYGGRYAVALLDRDLGVEDAGWLGVMDAAMTDFLATGEPLFEATLREGRPTTAASGQLLMVIGAGVGSFAFNEDTSNWVQVGIPGHGRSVSRFVVYHEIAHAWQFRYMQARVGGSPWEFTNWAMEGGANFLAREAQREIAGQSFLGNLPISQAFGGFGLSLSTFPQDNRDSGAIWDFNRGYGGSEWLMRDVMFRLISQGGMSLAGALREVAQGSLDGWFGGSSPQGYGLEQRVTERLGGPWEPANAILLALASIAVDDLVDSELLQAPYAHRVADHHRPAGQLHAGQGRVVSRLAGDATASGFFRIGGEERGGSYRMGADVDGLEWLLVRER